jgi:serine protease inhibitor
MSAGKLIVQEAKQEVRFGMNEEGARAKTATALAVRAAASALEHIVVDDDFLLWIERPGVAVPLFAGYLVKHDAWRDPGSLANV